MKATTKVRETLNGHTVEFTIGVQSFSLQEIEKDPEEDSREMALWYEKQLQTAFDNLVSDKEDKEEKCSNCDKPIGEVDKILRFCFSCTEELTPSKD